MTIRRISQNELKKIGRSGVAHAEDLPPLGIAPILRASWRFARNVAHRFSRELLSDRTKEFLSTLAKKFT